MACGSVCVPRLLGKANAPRLGSPQKSRLVSADSASNQSKHFVFNRITVLPSVIVPFIYVAAMERANFKGEEVFLERCKILDLWRKSRSLMIPIAGSP